MKTIQVDTTAPTDASNHDREWFADHSRRQFRLRPIIPNEFAPIPIAPPPDGEMWVAVARVGGNRLRTPFAVVASQRPEDSDVAGEHIFKLIHGRERWRRLRSIARRAAR